jgi:hypothetical protein
LPLTGAIGAIPKEIIMRKLAIGFAAVLALSATALLPTAASAKGGWHGGGFHGGFHGHSHGGFHGHRFGGPRLIVSGGYTGCYVKRLVETRYGLRYRVVNVCY